MSSSSWFERNKKLSIGVGVAAVVGVAAAGIWYLNKKQAASVSDPSSPSASAGQAHASLAMKHHKAGSHLESIESWNSAILADPSNFKYYNNRAQSHMLLNNYEQALADADQAIRLNPQAAGGYYNRGRAALKLERFEDAATAFTLALQQSDASKIASQAQMLLKTCQDKIAKIRESRLKSVAGTKKPSPVNTTRVSPTNSGITSPTTAAAQKHTQQVAKVASTIVSHAKPVEPTLSTPVSAAATRSPSPAPAPAPVSVPVPVATASTTSPSTAIPATPSSTQPDLSSRDKIESFLAEQTKIAQETAQKQKAVQVAEKIVDAVTHTPTTSNTPPTKPNVSTTAPVQIPSIFSPTNNTKTESPVSPVSSDAGSTSNSGIFERSAVLVPDGSASGVATTPPPKHQSRLSFMTPDLLSDTTTIDAETSVPIEAFAAIATGTPLQSPPSVFRSISSEATLSTPINGFGNGVSSSSSNNSNSTSVATSPILLNKQTTIKQQQQQPQPNAPLAFSGENPLDEM